MSILKGIMHHWNKTTKSYDTIHAETEYAQVTDWDAGIGATLAKTTLGSLITTLSSDSFAAKIVKLVLDATGMKYSMGTNGYICFGSLFGGLIIQWATENKTIGNDEGTYVILPLTFPTKCVTALLSDTYGRLSNSSAMANQTEGAKVHATNKNSVQIINYWSGGLDTAVTVLAIGY